MDYVEKIFFMCRTLALSSRWLITQRGEEGKIQITNYVRIIKAAMFILYHYLPALLVK